MMKHHRIQKQLYDYLHEGVTPEIKAEIEQHLGTCGRCSAELRSLRSALAILPRPSSPPADERDAAFWDGFPAAVAERIAAEGPETGGWLKPLRDIVHDLIVPQRRLLIAAGGAIAVVGTMIVGWNAWQHRAFEPGERVESIAVRTASADDPLGQYFRRSKVLLVGLSNMPTADGVPVDLSVERSTSRELIREARSFDDTPLDPRSTLLLRDLQKILIELANMEQTTDIPNVEIIRSGIRRENLLFKIRMAEATRDSVRLMQAKYSF